MASEAIARQAVVIGGGIAGLAAAKALSDHFEQVVILERDAVADGPAHRPGTPQSRHAHALLAGGQRALSELFPGFEQDLLDMGAVPVVADIDIRSERPGYDPFPQRDLGLTSYALSRPALEFAVRRRLRSCANISLRDRCRVGELLASGDGTAVTGVRFEVAGAGHQKLGADLVVDASAHGVPTLGLLRTTGHPAPEETIIGVDQGYATAVFHIPGDAPADWKAAMTFGGLPPNEARGALLWPMEGNRWILSLGERHGGPPPGDVDSFMAFTRTLRTPTIYNAVRNARLEGEIARSGFRDNVLRHFERLEVFPRGLIPIGDVLCRFNPVHGQGMSVAAQEACLLRKLLADQPSAGDPLQGLTKAFFERIPALVDTPWSVATFDFMHPATRGQRPADFETRVRYAAAFRKLAAADVEIDRLGTEVQHLLKPRSVYQDPALMQRLLLALDAV
jgi:2-polyprenyl-6-methoxyphenol hydroxylase-like FAD-dependent oxidoreductase